MTTIQALKSITAYPIPPATLQSIAEGCGLLPEDEATPEARETPAFKRATARTYIYLLTAPNISQNGISFSFSADERKRFKALSKALLDEIGDDTSCLGSGVKYGYKGEDF